MKSLATLALIFIFQFSAFSGECPDESHIEKAQAILTATYNLEADTVVFVDGPLEYSGRRAVEKLIFKADYINNLGERESGQFEVITSRDFSNFKEDKVKIEMKRLIK